MLSKHNVFQFAYQLMSSICNLWHPNRNHLICLVWTCWCKCVSVKYNPALLQEIERYREITWNQTALKPVTLWSCYIHIRTSRTLAYLSVINDKWTTPMVLSLSVSDRKRACAALLYSHPFSNYAMQTESSGGQVTDLRISGQLVHFLNHSCPKPIWCLQSYL